MVEQHNPDKIEINYEIVTSKRRVNKLPAAEEVDKGIFDTKYKEMITRQVGYDSRSSLENSRSRSGSGYLDPQQSSFTTARFDRTQFSSVTSKQVFNDGRNYQGNAFHDVSSEMSSTEEKREQQALSTQPKAKGVNVYDSSEGYGSEGYNLDSIVNYNKYNKERSNEQDGIGAAYTIDDIIAHNEAIMRRELNKDGSDLGSGEYENVPIIKIEEVK